MQKILNKIINWHCSFMKLIKINWNYVDVLSNWIDSPNHLSLILKWSWKIITIYIKYYEKCSEQIRKYYENVGLVGTILRHSKLKYYWNISLQRLLNSWIGLELICSLIGMSLTIYSENIEELLQSIQILLKYWIYWIQVGILAKCWSPMDTGAAREGDHQPYANLPTEAWILAIEQTEINN